MTAAVAEPGIVKRVFRDVMRAMIHKAQNTEGVMVALFLPPEVAAELAQPGGVPADQLHLTLRVFAPDAGEVDVSRLDALAAAIQRIATQTPVLSGNVSGIGRFNGDQAGGGQDVVYATLDIAGLVGLYDQLRWCYPWDQDKAPGIAGTDEPDHDFTPHVTLQYGNGVELPDVATTPVRFDRLTLAIGDDRREYLFGGADVADIHDGPTTKAEKSEKVTRDTWTTAYINGLPDSAFAIIKPGGTKDDEGKTTPRDLRMLPYKDDSGAVDAPHLRNSLSRVAQANTDLTDEQRASAKTKLAAAAQNVLAKAIEEAGELVAKAMGESGWEGELEVEAIALDETGVIVRAGGPSGTFFRVEKDDSGAFTTTDLGSGGMLAPQQGMPKRRRPNRVAKSTKLDLDRYGVLKSAPEQRYSLGVAYPAKQTRKADAQDTDAHGEEMTAEELERSAWQFMAGGAKDSGLMHKDGTDGAGQVVESYIYRGPTWKVDDQSVEAGDWLLGVVWDEPSWDAIKAGQLTGYSLQGMAARESA